MATRFWVGGTGNWDASTTTNWAATTGGAGGQSVPTSADDVTFDASSGTAATVTITAAANAKTIIVNKSDLTLMHNAGSTVAGLVTLTTGILNTNSQTCSWWALLLTSGTFTMGSSAITITGNLGNTVLYGGNTSITANTAIMTFSISSSLNGGSGSGTSGWNGLSLVVSSTVTTFSLLNSPKLKDFTMIGPASVSGALSFSGGPTTTGTFTITGNSVTNRIILKRYALGGTCTITANAVALTNVDFQDCAGSGAAAPFTGTSVGDCGGNSGITFDTPTTRYWVGGSGNWSDTAHWAGATGATGWGYQYLPGVTANYVSAPDSVPLSITGDIDVRCKVALSDWTPAASTALVGKYLTTGNQRSYLLYVQSNGKIIFSPSTDGTAPTGIASSVAPTVADGAVKWIRVTFRASDGRVQFFTSDDGSAWTQLGTDQTSAARSLYDSTALVEIGTYSAGTAYLAQGKFYRAQIRNNILDDGTGIVFDADFTIKTCGNNTFTESSSNAATVTITGALAQLGDGRAGQTVPLPQDSVKMDANSFTAGSSTPTVDVPRACKDWDWTGANNSPKFALGVNTTIFGSYTGTSAVARTSSGGITLTFAGRGTHTITSGTGFGWPATTMAAPGGTYTLQDTFFNANGFTLQWGTLNGNGQAVTNAGFTANSTGTMTLNMGSGTWSVYPGAFSWDTSAATLTVNASTSSIVFLDTSSTTKTFAGGDKTYNNLTLTDPSGKISALTITGANTFNTLTVPPGTQLTMPATTTTTFTGLFAATGSPYGYQYFGNGYQDNSASTPDSVPLSVTGDITVDVKAALDVWDPTSSLVRTTMVAKDDASTQRSVIFDTYQGGKLEFIFSLNGSALNIYQSTVGTGFAAGSTNWVRATRVASTGVITFYTSGDGTSWTQLGTTVTGVTGNIFDGTGPLYIGDDVRTAAQHAAGKYYRVRIYSDVTQTTKVFDADFTTKTPCANTFTESSTNAATVTINGGLAQAGDGRVALISSASGVPATLSTSNFLQSCDYLSIKDSTATGVAKWYAGAHSIDATGNNGWTFSGSPSANFFALID